MIFLFVCILALPAISFAATYGEWNKAQFSEKSTHGHPKFSNNGEYLLVLEQRGVSATGKVWLLKPGTGEKIWKFEAKNKSFFDSAISDDGSYIAVAGSDLVLLSNQSATPLWKVASKRAVFNVVAISGDGQYIAVGTRGGEVKLFSASSTKEVGNWTVCKDPVEAIAISKDGNYIIAGGLGKAVLISRERKAIINSFTLSKKNNKPDKTVSVAISNDGQKYTVATYDGNMYLFDRDYAKPFWVAKSGTNVKLKTDVNDTGNNIVLTSDNKYWGFTADSAVSKWNFVNKGRFPDLSVSENGKFIAVADQSKSVYVFDRDFTYNGGETRPIRTYPAVFPGNIAISGLGDKIVYDEKAGMKYREVAPGVLSELKDSVTVYRTDDTMRLRTFVSNPSGNIASLKMEVHLSLPQFDFWKKAGKAATGKLDSMVPKELSSFVSSITGGGSVFEDNVPYNLPTYVSAQSSLDQTLDITVPKMNGNQEDMGFMSSFDFVGKAFDFLGDLLKKVMPDNLANWVTDATKAYFTGQSNLQNGMQPAIGLGQVIITDLVTGKVVDSDTFIFVYIMEG